MLRLLALALPLLAAALPAPAAAVAQDTARVEIFFFDVGQGDAALVISPEGKVALIDAGRSGPSVAHRLAALGVDTIHLAVASHAHADHIGGMAQVLWQFPVRAYLDNAMPHNTGTYRSLMRLVRSSDVTYLEPTARTIELGSVRLRVLPPPEWATDQNNRSVGILLEFGEFRALFPGDAQVDALNHFMALGVPRVTVLKAAHHGARNGVSPGWINGTRPAVVVISVGARNQYGHPDPSALRYYATSGRPIYRTDVHGHIVIYGARDGSFEVETQHDR